MGLRIQYIKKGIGELALLVSKMKRISMLLFHF